MKCTLALIAMLALAGCGAVTPRIETKPVDVAVAETCTPNIGPEPQYVDSDSAMRAAANLYERVKLLLAGRIQRIERDRQKTIALEACGAPPL